MSGKIGVSHTITGIAFYALEIMVSITISVIDTIWLSMFRRKFLSLCCKALHFVTSIPEYLTRSIISCHSFLFFCRRTIYSRWSSIDRLSTIRTVRNISSLSVPPPFYFLFLARTLSLSLALSRSHIAPVQLVEKLRQLYTLSSLVSYHSFLFSS